jgi:hypothetical protein
MKRPIGAFGTIYCNKNIEQIQVSLASKLVAIASPISCMQFLISVGIESNGFMKSLATR